MWIGNTGYGYGETEGVELTERLLALFAENLDGSMSVGEALLYAKQTYLGTRQAEYGPFDEKVLQQSTFYGLPIYRIGVAEVPPPAPVPPSPARSPLSGTDLEVAGIAADLVFDQAPTDGGTRFTVSVPGGDPGQPGQQATPFAPILPTVSYDVSAVGDDGRGAEAVAQGAFITGLRSRDVPDVDPDIARPIVDDDDKEPEPAVGRIATEPTVFASSFRTPEGPRQALTAVAASFRSTDRDGRGTMRLFEELDFEVFYRSPGSGADQRAPVFGAISSTVQQAGGSAFLVISVRVDDPGGVERVLALVGQDPAGGTRWVPVELTRQEGRRWSGAVAVSGRDIEFLVQAVDGNGNVALSTNKARSYLGDDQPEPGAAGIDIDLDRQPDDGLFHTSPVTVSASAGGQEIDYRIDGGPATAGGPAPSVVLDPAVLGDGAHTVRFTLPDGTTRSVTVLFDTTPPEIRLAPGDGTAVTSPVQVAFACADGGSGAALCRGLLDGDPVASGALVELAPGEHRLVVQGVDALGNAASAAATFTVAERGGPGGPGDPACTVVGTPRVTTCCGAPTATT